MAKADPADNEGQAPRPGVMPDRLPENAPVPDFDPKALAKSVVRSTRAGALATIDRNTGHPFASLVNVETDSDGAPLILISRLATHTANLEADGRASLLLAAGGKGDPLAHPRLTLIGSFLRLTREYADEPRLRRRFRGFFVMPARRRLRPSQWRLRSRRRSQSRRCHDRCRRGSRPDRSRGER